MIKRKELPGENSQKISNTSTTSSFDDGFGYLKGLTVPKPGTLPDPNAAPVDPWLTFLNEQINNFSTTSPDAYIGQAKSLLGDLDLSALDELRRAYEATYATNKGSLDTSYNNLMDSLGKQQKENSQNFAQSRATISENSFSRGRDLYRNLAARGLGASGLQQLGDVQNRMATGREVNQAAGQFYDTSEKIADTKKQGTDTYNAQSEMLSNNLNTALAGVSQQEIQYRNAYQQQLAEIAMSLQSSALAQQNSKYNLEAQLAQYESQQFNETKAKTSEVSKMEIISNEGMSDVQKAAVWADTFGIPIEQATAEMKAYDKDFSEKLRVEAFSKFDDPTSKISSWTDMGSIISDMKAGFSEGVFSREDIRKYISQNYDKFAQKNIWGGDVFDATRLAISMGIGKRDKNDVIEAMLDYFKIK